MRFYGTYEHAIDEKGRIIMPAKLREGLGNRFYITRGFDKCLAVYTCEKWEQFMCKLEELPKSDKRSRAFSHRFVANAMEAEPDKNNRVVISPSLRKLADLKKEIVTIGQNDYIEIWDKEAWEEYSAHYEDEEIDFTDFLF